MADVQKEEEIDKNVSLKKRGLIQNDWFLQMLVSLVENGSGTGEAGITLISHGFLITGKIVSAKEYFEGFGDDFATSFADPAGEAASIYKKAFLEISEKINKKEDDNDGNVNLLAFIHLKDAQVLHPGAEPVPGNRGVWWRGRISEISGFMLGTLSI